MKRITIATVLAAASIAIAAPAFAGHGEEGEGCDHGATSKPCRPDPQASHGKDCEKHGNHGGINEDHCGPASTPSPTTTGGTSSTSTTSTPPTTSSTTSPTSSVSTSPTSSTTTRPTAPPSTSSTSTNSSPTGPPSSTTTVDGPPSSRPPVTGTTTPSTPAPTRSTDDTPDSPSELARTGTKLSDTAAWGIFLLGVGGIVAWVAWALGRNREH